MAIVLGMVTGIGGVILRDVLLAKIPIVLRAELYAVAALAAAAIVVVGHMLQFPVVPVTTLALASCCSAARHGDEAWVAASDCEDHRLVQPCCPIRLRRDAVGC